MIQSADSRTLPTDGIWKVERWVQLTYEDVSRMTKVMLFCMNGQTSRSVSRGHELLSMYQCKARGPGGRGLGEGSGMGGDFDIFLNFFWIIQIPHPRDKRIRQTSHQVKVVEGPSKLDHERSKSLSGGHNVVQNRYLGDRLHNQIAVVTPSPPLRV